MEEMMNKYNCLALCMILTLFSTLSAHGQNFEKSDSKEGLFGFTPQTSQMDSSAFMLALSKWAWTKGTIINFEQADGDFGVHTFSLAHQNGENILNLFCSNTRKYVWLKSGRVINVVPRSCMDDPTYVLNYVIPNFSVRGKDRFQIYDQIIEDVNRLSPGKMDLNSSKTSEPYKIATSMSKQRDGINTPKMSFEVRNTSIRNILNIISEKENAFWRVRREIGYPGTILDFSSELYFSFYNLMQSKNDLNDRHDRDRHRNK